MEFPRGLSASHEKSQEVGKKEQPTKIPPSPKEKKIKTKAQWMQQGDNIPQPKFSNEEGAKFNQGVVLKQEATMGPQAAYHALEIIAGDKDKPRGVSPSRAPRKEAVALSPKKTLHKKETPSPRSALSLDKEKFSEEVSKLESKIKDLEVQREDLADKIRQSKSAVDEAGEAYDAAQKAQKAAQGKATRASASLKKCECDDFVNQKKYKHSHLHISYPSVVEQLNTLEVPWDNEKVMEIAAQEFIDRGLDIEVPEIQEALKKLLEDIFDLEQWKAGQEEASELVEETRAQSKEANAENELAKDALKEAGKAYENEKNKLAALDKQDKQKQAEWIEARRRLHVLK